MNFQKLSSLISGKLGLKASLTEPTDPGQPTQPTHLNDQQIETSQQSILDASLECTIDHNTNFESQNPSPVSEPVEPSESFMDYDHITVTHYTDEQLLQSKLKLKELMRGCPGIYGILIHTVDGHDLLSVFTRDIPSTKISTMTSSFLALGESIARESLQAFCQFTMIENSDGRIVSLRINEILMLTCISTKDSNLGMLLSTGRMTADTISKLLGNRP